ncbi:SPFH domain-containing protein [Fusibacter sp. JL216-2]|uniref:SPFH domain-containing protein n=1 Tax=Fusibacter sp. JL216-2 TaxID=3071453 RepID=UPI003D332F1A
MDNNNNRGPGPDLKDEFSKFKEQFKSQASSHTSNVNPEEVKKRRKRNMRFTGFILILLAFLMSASSFIYVVREDEVATVREFGDVKKVIVDRDNIDAEEQSKLDKNFQNIEIVKDKGLFFKIPFITKVQKDSSKLITYISNYANINTKDKIKYEIKMFAQWEITHPGLYRSSFGGTGNLQIQANRLIDEVGYALVIQAINALDSNEFLQDKEVLNAKLDEAMVDLNTNLAQKGIVVRDIEVYRTILPDSNIESTLQKMVAERAAIAQQKRSEGQELYQNTVADTDREVAQIIAESIETSETIRGEADATALEIYADAFSVDPDFYKLWRTLKSYETTLDEDTVIYMNSDNDYLELFNQGE